MIKEVNRQQIYLDDITGYRPYRGHVLIKIAPSKEGHTTPAGIIVGFDSEKKFTGESDTHIADLTSTEGIVFATPLLHYTPDYTIENEIEVGDHVWFSYFGSLHGKDVWVGKDLYRLIGYEYLNAAKRGEEIIILNGQVFLEEVREYEKRYGDITILHPAPEKDRGIVRYLSKNNREYPDPLRTDDIELAIGDRVVIRDTCPNVQLERQSYLATFDGDKLYRRVKKSDIIAVLSSFTTGG